MLIIPKQLLSLGIFLLSFNCLFAQLTATITDSVDAACIGTCNGSAIVTVTGGGTPPYIYLWDDPANQTDSTATGLCADTFTVMVTDSGNVDTAYATVIIGVIESPMISSVTVDTNVSCFGDSTGGATATITGGTPPYDFIWSSGDTILDTNSLTNSSSTLPSGQNSVTIIDSIGCMVTDTVTIVELQSVSATVDSNINCLNDSTWGATATITLGTPPFNYLWSSGDTTLDTNSLTNSISGLPLGTYMVTVIDSNGCTPPTENINIIEPVHLKGTIIVVTSESCNGCNDGDATAVISGATPPYTYLWDDPLNQTNATATGLSAGVYSVTVTDSLGCSIVICGRRIFVGDTLFFEGFQSGADTCFFKLIDNDNLTPDPVTSFVDEAWVVGDNPGEAGDSVAFSNSMYISGDSTADDWLITPPVINLDSNAFLVWDAKVYNSAFRDGYEVRISTAGNSITDFMSSSSLIYTISEENSTWTTRSINLGEKYANDTIYIAFRNNSKNKFLLLIDDIYVGKPRFEPKLIQAKVSSDYYLTPLSQASFTFEGLIENIGSDPLSNVKLLLDVNSGAFQDSAFVNSLVSGDTATIANTNPFVPTAFGTYNVDFQVTADLSANVDSTYNMSTASFIVSDTIYARENGIATGLGLGFGVGTSGVLGHTFDIINPGRLTSVTFKLEAPSIGDTLLAEIYNFTTQPDTIITTTEMLIVPSPDPAWYTLNVNGGGVNLDSGKYFIGIRQSYTNTVGLAKTEFNYIPGAGWVKAGSGSSGNWINIENIGPGFPVTFLIRANIQKSASGKKATDNFSEYSIPVDIKIYPNPTRGIINIFYNFENSKPITIKIYNLTGKEVGAYNSISVPIYSIDLSDQVNGIYFISIQTQENIFTKKFIISKN